MQLPDIADPYGPRFRRGDAEKAPGLLPAIDSKAMRIDSPDFCEG
jgi:hypothetical protein